MLYYYYHVKWVVISTQCDRVSDPPYRSEGKGVPLTGKTKTLVKIACVEPPHDGPKTIIIRWHPHMTTHRTCRWPRRGSPVA